MHGHVMASPDLAQVDPVYFPQMEVVGDIGNGIWQIMERLKDWTPTWDLRHAPGRLSVSCCQSAVTRYGKVASI